jgi:hypothetical protein
MGTLDQIKKSFFDTERVINSMDKATHRSMRYFGGYVRKAAMRSIKERKKGPSPVGMPPRNVTGKLRESILFDYNVAKKMVVIGPWAFERMPSMPQQLLEHGGTVLRLKPYTNFKGITTWKPKFDKQIVIWKYGGNPYMKPAFDRSKAKFLEKMKNSMRK